MPHPAPNRISISDSIVDATRSGGMALSGGVDGRPAYAHLIVKRSTVFGAMRLHALELAENSIFTGCVEVARRQIGCMRFCYAPRDSRTPRRYHREPDGARRTAIEALIEAARESGSPPPDDDEAEAAAEIATRRVRKTALHEPALRPSGLRAARARCRARDHARRRRRVRDGRVPRSVPTAARRESAAAARRIHTGKHGRRHFRCRRRSASWYQRRNSSATFTHPLLDAANRFSRAAAAGRVTLDADTNEQTEILLHYLRTLAHDLIGDFGGPINHGGFELRADGDKLHIGAGRYYVHGILVESDGTHDYAHQPDFTPELPDSAGGARRAAWLEKASDEQFRFISTWERHITAIEDPAPARARIDQIDTCTRTQVIWQVRAIALSEMIDAFPRAAAGAGEAHPGNRSRWRRRASRERNALVRIDQALAHLRADPREACTCAARRFRRRRRRHGRAASTPQSTEDALRHFTGSTPSRRGEPVSIASRSIAAAALIARRSSGPRQRASRRAGPQSRAIR